VDRRFAGVFSTRPAFIYRIKNKVTVTCDFSKKKKTKAKTFAIFSNSFGDIDTEDLDTNKIIEKLFTSDLQLRNWIEDDAEDVYNTKLPMDIKNQLDAVDDRGGPLRIRCFRHFAPFCSQDLWMGYGYSSIVSLWTSKELERAIKSRENLLPFSLPRERKFAPTQGLVEILLSTGRVSSEMARIIGNIDGGEDPLQNFQKLFSYTLTQEFFVETFEVKN
jgi:hypothetical protein